MKPENGPMEEEILLENRLFQVPYEFSATSRRPSPVGVKDTNERPSLYWFFSCRAFSKLFNLSTGQWLSRTISRTIRLNSAGESDKCRFIFFNKLTFASLVRKYTFITSCVKALGLKTNSPWLARNCAKAACASSALPAIMRGPKIQKEPLQDQPN